MIKGVAPVIACGCSVRRMCGVAIAVAQVVDMGGCLFWFLLTTHLRKRKTFFFYHRQMV